MEGFSHIEGYLGEKEQLALVETLREIVAEAPLYHPQMPRSGRPFSVRMTNCGTLGWVSDKQGYRYQENHPASGNPWPTMPEAVQDIWNNLAQFSKEPECCLINYYDEGAKMGLHRDEDEEDFSAPVVSISLGDTARFRIGGKDRKDPTRSFKLSSGDALVMAGPARLAYHGVDRIYPGSSELLTKGGRLNLTLRRVRP
ncbi:MAG: alpha-ketoglutarate-dependent dioxygenase AlkB family protein [Hyphomicrobiales bacterium]